MKIRGYKFGHPVFGQSDYYDFSPIFEIDSEISDRHLIISCKKFDLGSNQALTEMLSDNRAQFVAEIFCSFTMYRKMFRLDSDFKISLPLSEIKNKVECFFFILSNQEIDDFQSSSIRSQLQNQTFFIEKGDILGIFEDHTIHLELEGTGVDSIVKIREHSRKEKSISYIFIEDSIIIEIHKDQFELMKKFRLNPDYQHILISGLLQPALIHACYYLLKEDFEEKPWYEILMLRWNRFSENEEAPSENEIPAFVEHLLQDPTDHLLNVLQHMDEKNQEELV